MTPPGQKAGASLAVLTAAALILAGLLQPTVVVPQHHVAIYADPAHGLMAGPTCLWTTALGEPSALALFGLQSDAGSRYCLAHICAPEADAGPDGESYALPPQMFPLSATQSTDAYDGGPVIEIWDQDAPDAPWQCACSTGSSCSVPSDDGGTQPAPFGVTLQPGWSGAGCHPRSCVVFAGFDPWPEVCPR